MRCSQLWRAPSHQHLAPGRLGFHEPHDVVLPFAAHFLHSTRSISTLSRLCWPLALA